MEKISVQVVQTDPSLKPDESTGQSGRLIDAYQMKRTKPMKVLVLGMCRTGTSSMREALKILGYTPHHMIDILGDPTFFQSRLWGEACRDTFLDPSKKPFGRAEFDKLTGWCDALTDLPSALFVDQLVAAYPDAKVILTNRNVESWIKSMNATIFKGFRWPSFYLLSWLDLYGERYFFTFLHDAWGAFNDGGGLDDASVRKSYLEHYEHVRRVVPKDNLLEFGAPYSWEPLCDFLGKDVPAAVEYPRVNDSADFERLLLYSRRNAGIKRALKLWAPWMAGAIGVGAAVYMRGSLQQLGKGLMAGLRR